jgi:hypothetical protein
MNGIADIIAMLSERTLSNDIYQSIEDKQIQLIEYLFRTIQTFLSSSSFKIYNKSTLNQKDSSDDLLKDVS